MRTGNKENSILNGECATHVRKWGKKFTASLRRTQNKKIIKQEKDNYEIRNNG